MNGNSVMSERIIHADIDAVYGLSQRLAVD